MGLNRESVRTKLAASLLDAVDIFGDDAAAQAPHLDRHIDVAVAEFNRVAPLLIGDQLQLTQDESNYAAPAGAIRFHGSEIVDRQNALPPWDEFRVPEVPTPSIVRVAGVKCWNFRPAPSGYIVARIGVAYPYTYVSAHVLGADEEAEDDTTIEEAHEPLLIMRAQVESLKDLAIRNAHKPVALRDPTYSQTKNGTPAALADQFFRMWEQQMRPATDLYGTLKTSGTGR